MRKALSIAFVIALACVAPAWCQDDSAGDSFSPEQLDNLLAPIALYPDPLLAQVLVAATFPDQIDEAARFVRANDNPDSLDDAPWDVSVKAVAHYPTVLSIMADKLDWTTALGQAYVNQSSDVMATVQRLRTEARSAGNLETTPQQQVLDQDGYIEIWPAEPQYIYVPLYDPSLIYFHRTGSIAGISFGRGFFIGAWLNNDFDWGHHRVYYHGWDDARGWIARSRPFVRVSHAYVNANYRNVAINRTVVSRIVNYTALNRYQSVHHDVPYSNLRVDRNVVADRRPVNGEGRPPVVNKVIERNIDVSDSRLDSYRGHSTQAPNRPEITAFGGHQGGFSTQAASQRGQESRRVFSSPPPTHNERSSESHAAHSDRSSGPSDHGRRR
jgi:hypothetical protein